MAQRNAMHHSLDEDGTFKQNCFIGGVVICMEFV